MFQVESRAQMAVPAAHAARSVLRHRRAGAIIRPGPIVGKMVHPYLQPAAGARDAGVPASVARARAAPHARRAALPGAVAAHGDDRRRIHRRRGRRTAPRIRLQALGEAHARDRGEAPRTAWTRNGITGPVQDTIVQSITSFALYGFPESHAASFAFSPTRART